MTDLKTSLFEFLTAQYIQDADARQKAMGLQYMQAETHDLAREISKFLETQPSRPIHAPDLRDIPSPEHK